MNPEAVQALLENEGLPTDRPWNIQYSKYKNEFRVRFYCQGWWLDLVNLSDADQVKRCLESTGASLETLKRLNRRKESGWSCS